MASRTADFGGNSSKQNSGFSKALTSTLGGSFGGRIGEALAQASKTAVHTAKFGLDQVLLGLQHRGLNLEESKDVIQQVGRRVLERAEQIRSQIASNPMSPAWLKDVSLGAKTEAGEIVDEDGLQPADRDASMNVADSGSVVSGSALSGDAAGSIVDATISDPAVKMQPEEFEKVLRAQRAEKETKKSTKALHGVKAGAKAGVKAATKPKKPTVRGKKAKNAKTVTVATKSAKAKTPVRSAKSKSAQSQAQR